MTLQHNGPAPYTAAPAATLVLERARKGNLPTPLDAAVLERIGVQTSLARRTLNALGLLGLIDDAGQPTQTLVALQNAHTAEYPMACEAWLRESYSEVFGIVGDLAEATYEQIDDAFRGYTPTGQRARMVALFIGLCEYANLVPQGKLRVASRPVELQLSSPSRTARRAAKSVPSRPPKRDETQQKTAEDASLNRSLADHDNPALDPMVQGLIARLPPLDSPWPAAKRRAWMRAAEAVFDVIYELPSDESEEVKP